MLWLTRTLFSSKEQAGSPTREGKTKFNANTTLDSLYTSILQEAFGNDDDPDNDPKVRSVLGALVLATNPLSPSAIATILGFDAEDALPLLSSTQSLIILREDICRPVRPLHKSFPDFIVDPKRCSNQRFCISPPDHHSRLLIGCFDLMNRTLEKNMCTLPKAVANSDVGDLKERARQYINPPLRCACRSWHAHLVDQQKIPTFALEIADALQRFLEGKFLFWLEVLSVLGAARNAVDALRAAVGWLEEPPILDFANDCSRFVTT